MNQETLLLVLIALVAVIGGALALRLWRRPGDEASDAVKLLMGFQKEMLTIKESLTQQTLAVSKQLNSLLAQNSDFLTQTHRNYHDTVSQVQHRLGELQQTTRSMMDIGKDISSLQDILRAPKLRGGFGELFLGELLRQVLPEDHYALQYAFRDGRKVDAAIFLNEGIVPVDAKFPLENFRRLLDAKTEDDVASAKKSFTQDVKKHIDDIAAKYILPQEGTFEFALMYIPAENVYYETIIKDERAAESLANYAMQKKVIPVSPNSFYAYLQAVGRGLKGLRVERSAKRILEGIGQLETDLKKFLTEFEKLGSHLGNAMASYERSVKGFDKLQLRVSSLDSDKAGQLTSEEVSAE